MRALQALWHRAFLVERSSVSLSLFRIALAITVGCHMIPSFLELGDNYLSTAYKEYNASFFPLSVLRLVAQSPDWLVYAFVVAFAITGFCFLIGFVSQLSGILMTGCCYYFYALNSLHIGTLSFDILLVTLVLMCVTGYHGDSFSVDSLIRGDPQAYRRARPYFLQRLLQLQLFWTFWHTGLGKISSAAFFPLQGNWLIEAPYYYLMHYPSQGVVRAFPFRDFLAQHPAVCYGIGVGMILCEFIIPILWFIRRTRLPAIAFGIFFQIMLLVTLHVPTIFFFLFPPQMLLFVNPDKAVAWIEARRARRRAAKARGTLLYDGQCGFCLASVARLLVLDPFGYLEPIDFHTVSNLTSLHPELTTDRCRSRMQLIEPGGRLSEGFFSVRRLSLKLPFLMPLAPALYLPGMAWIGQRTYDWVARRRFVFHRGRQCTSNQCGLPLKEGDSSSKV